MEYDLPGRGRINNCRHRVFIAPGQHLYFVYYEIIIKISDKKKLVAGGYMNLSLYFLDYFFIELINFHRLKLNMVKAHSKYMNYCFSIEGLVI